MGLDYAIPRSWLEKANATLSGIMSYLSGKPDRATKVELIPALSVASLTLAVLLIWGIVEGYEELDISVGSIVTMIIGVLSLVALGGTAYSILLDLISRLIRRRRIIGRAQKRTATRRDIVVSNFFLLVILVVVISIVALSFGFVETNSIMTNWVLPIILILFFPALLGSLFYLVISGAITLLGRIGRMEKGALGPVALGLFVLGGGILLIVAW